MPKTPRPTVAIQLLVIALAVCGMMLFIKLSLIRPRAWWSTLLRGGGYVCAVVGAATVFDIAGRAFSSKKPRDPEPR